MANSSQLLVLVADDKSGKLCTNYNGVTRMLRQIDRATPGGNSGRANPADGKALHMFACELMMALGRQLHEQLCDGVVIFADGPMMEELRRVQTGTVAQRLLAMIAGKPNETSRFPGISAGKAQLAYCGAIQ